MSGYDNKVNKSDWTFHLWAVSSKSHASVARINLNCSRDSAEMECYAIKVYKSDLTAHLLSSSKKVSRHCC